MRFGAAGTALTAAEWLDREEHGRCIMCGRQLHAVSMQADERGRVVQYEVACPWCDMSDAEQVRQAVREARDVG